MANLADRMTDTLRQEEQYQDLLFSNPGDVLVVEPYIHVRWPWLILPVVTLLASSGLLVTSILSSHGRRDMIWKNSSLALLFHGLGPNGLNQQVNDKTSMESAADRMNVQLKEDVQGDLHLVSVQNSSSIVFEIKPTHADI